jgi:uncharacterized protein YcbK (DUF882 family)
MLNRRRFLVLGAAATTSALLSQPAKAAPRLRIERSVSLHNVHTGESLRTTYWAEGHYQLGALHQLNHLLRDHYTGTSHPMDPRVIDVLSALQHRLGAGKPLLVISGYRSPATNAWLASMNEGVARHSLHMEGKAIDIRLEGSSVRTLGRAARSLRAGGVGQYPESGFVHVDVGRIRYW